MITASIVVYNSPMNQLQTAVDCILRSKIARLWIVYNGPDEKINDYKSIAGTEFIRVANNGFGAGHNVAIRKALEVGSDYHLVMNADIRWKGDAITPLAKKMDDDTDIALIAPEVTYPDGRLQYTCRMLPRPIDLFARRFLGEKLAERLDYRYLLKDIDHKRPINAPYFIGCFMLLRLSAIRETGAFDERYFMYPEDIDLTRRLHRKWKTLYYPAVSIVHEHQQESRKNYRMLKIHISNMIKYFNKWGWFFDKERRDFNLQLRQKS